MIDRFLLPISLGMTKLTGFSVTDSLANMTPPTRPFLFPLMGMGGPGHGEPAHLGEMGAKFTLTSLPSPLSTSWCQCPAMNSWTGRIKVATRCLVTITPPSTSHSNYLNNF